MVKMYGKNIPVPWILWDWDMSLFRGTSSRRGSLHVFKKTCLIIWLYDYIQDTQCMVYSPTFAQKNTKHVGQCAICIECLEIYLHYIRWPFQAIPYTNKMVKPCLSANQDTVLRALRAAGHQSPSSNALRMALAAGQGNLVETWKDIAPMTWIPGRVAIL